MTPADSAVDMLPLPRRRGEAFCALLENAPQGRSPGPRWDGNVGAGDHRPADAPFGAGAGRDTSTGEIMTAGEARRLACTAGILPVVLGGKSEVLDLGRTRRLFSPAQRKASRASATATVTAGAKAATSPPPGAKPTTRTPPGPAVAVLT